MAGLGIGGLFILSGVVISKGRDKEGHMLALATSALLIGGESSYRGWLIQWQPLHGLFTRHGGICMYVRHGAAHQGWEGRNQAGARRGCSDWRGQYLVPGPQGVGVEVKQDQSIS